MSHTQLDAISDPLLDPVRQQTKTPSPQDPRALDARTVSTTDLTAVQVAGAAPHSGSDARRPERTPGTQPSERGGKRIAGASNSDNSPLSRRLKGGK